jgi:hypothetical protein
MGNCMGKGAAAAASPQKGHHVRNVSSQDKYNHYRMKYFTAREISDFFLRGSLGGV